MGLPRIEATRYVMALREGGSLPGLVEASDDGLYVVKFRGAGQGAKALLAEVVAGELARELGLTVPDLALVDLDPALARAEPDREIQDLLAASEGLNLGIDFLPGALPFSPVAGPLPDPELAAAIVWFDALVTNVDRTVRNTNMLQWHDRLWLIDHGAALYFHHDARRELGYERTPFAQIAEHVLVPYAGSIRAADERLAPLVTDALLERVVAAIPGDWLDGENPQMYADYLRARLAAPRDFVEEAERARGR